MRKILKSSKLSNVLRDMRGPVIEAAALMEAAGRKVVRLNVGNLAHFDFEAADELRFAMISNMAGSAGYSDSKGIIPAREAIMREAEVQGTGGVTVDDIYLGNGASELISMALNTLLDYGDEILVPSPDFPLWTGAATLAGGVPVQYACDQRNGWLPVLESIKEKISARTRALVVVNPNNPTGALYDGDLLLSIIEIARVNQLVIFADEVCSKVLYDGRRHISIASLCDDVIILTFNSLSKSYLAGGFRAGWMVVSGPKKYAGDFIGGLNVLSNMKLCSNVPGQWAVTAALRGESSISAHVAPGGRLRTQRDLAHALMTAIPGVTCLKPSAGLYMFPRLDPNIYPIADDTQFCLDVLAKTGVMLVQGRAFHWPATDHFRMVFLPRETELAESLNRIAGFLGEYRCEVGTA